MATGSWHCGDCKEDFPAQLGVVLDVPGGQKVFLRQLGRWVIIPD